MGAATARVLLLLVVVGTCIGDVFNVVKYGAVVWIVNDQSLDFLLFCFVFIEPSSTQIIG